MHLATVENQQSFINPHQLDMVPSDEGDLRLLSDGKTSSIFYRDFCYGTFADDDKLSRNFFLSQLHLSGGFKIKDLSPIFKLQYQHCSKIIVDYKKSGLEGIRMDGESREGGRKRLITTAVGKEILKLREEGTSYEDISRAIWFRFRKKLKVSTLSTWVCNEKKKIEGVEPKQEQMAIELPPQQLTVVPELYEPELVEESSVVVVSGLNIYAGSMILYSMLARSNFLESFLKNIKENFNGPETWSVKRVLLTLFFQHALRYCSVEQGKHLVGRNFAEIVGGDFLRLQWLRYAVDDIVKRPGFEQAMTAHYKNMISETDQGDKLFYTDGHFSTYYGKRPVPKGYDPRRQMPYRGRNTVYLHNASGENVYLFESPTNTTLSNDIEILIKDMRDFGMELKGQTLCFDRGGWSQKCFRFLRANNILD